MATELPLLVEEYNLDTDGRDTLNAYVVGLQDWVAGILDWHSLCGRYNESALLRRYRRPPQWSAGPTGLGTAAVRITSMRLGAFENITIG